MPGEELLFGEIFAQTEALQLRRIILFDERAHFVAKRELFRRKIEIHVTQALCGAPRAAMGYL